MSLSIIAEIHPQHGGDPGVIREMIRQAKLHGADTVKVQLYDAEKLLGADWKYLELSLAQTAEIKKWCEDEGIEFLASVFDEERVKWCEDLGVRRYKIASLTLGTDLSLCEKIISCKKETLVSLGRWAKKEKPFPPHPLIKYLYCRAKYPALPADMSDFPRNFPAEGLHGYSDHTLGLDYCLLAITRGATIIEKHMSLNKMGGKKTEKAHICSMTGPELGWLRQFGGSLCRTVSLQRLAET